MHKNSVVFKIQSMRIDIKFQNVRREKQGKQLMTVKTLHGLAKASENAGKREGSNKSALMKIEWHYRGYYFPDYFIMAKKVQLALFQLFQDFPKSIKI